MIEVESAVRSFLANVVPSLTFYTGLIPRDAELPAAMIIVDGEHEPTIGADTGHDVVALRMRLTDEDKPGVDTGLTALYRPIVDTLSGHDDSHGAPTVDGYDVLDISRTKVVVSVEETEGRRYKHLGMTFAVTIERAP